MRIIAIKIPEDLLLSLDAYAMNHRLSRSDVIREAIECFLERNHMKRGWGR